VIGNGLLLANGLGVKPPTVSNWVTGKSSIPLRWITPIETFTKGAVRRMHMRPDDYLIHWPELAVAHILPAQPAIETVAEAPWDGKTERRKLDAPVDRRVSPESVAQAAFKRSQADIYG